MNDLLDPSMQRVLEFINDEPLTARTKVDLILKSYSPTELLRRTSNRTKLIQLLKKTEAQELADELGLSVDRSPFEALLDARIPRESEREALLFEFFGHNPPEPKADDHEDPELEEVRPTYGLFGHQKKSLEEVKGHLRSDQNRAFLHMPTGAGKTRIAMNVVAEELIEKEPTVVLWLAYGEELLNQAAEEFKEAWRRLGDRDVKLHRFYGSSEWREDLQDGVVVAGLTKLWNREDASAAFLPNLAGRLSLVVFDEAHQSVANTYKKIIQRTVDINPSCGLLGLSATPGRTWDDPEKDRELADLYRRNKVSLDVSGYEDPFEYLIEAGYLANPIFYQLPIKEGPLTNKEIEELEDLSDYPPHVLEKLAEDEARNILLTGKISDLIEDGHRRILFFATTVDHANNISAILENQDIPAETITAKTSDLVRERAIDRFTSSDPQNPMVLCNYNVLTTGFDAPEASAAVIARPTKSLVLYSQMVGRVIRGPRVGGTETADIWTVIDTQLPGFGDLTEAFWNWEDVW